MNPQDPNNYVQRAEIEVAQRDFELALGDYEKVIELQPDNRDAYRGRMRVKEMQNDFTGAMMERVRMTEEMVPPSAGPTPTNDAVFSRATRAAGVAAFCSSLTAHSQPTPTSPGDIIIAVSSNRLPTTGVAHWLIFSDARIFPTAG